MQFGICASVDESPHIRSAGWDFIEGDAHQVLQPQKTDGEWCGAVSVRGSALPVPVIFHELRGDMKVIGPNLSMSTLHEYTKILLKRASAVGARVVVFGSSSARKLPPDYDRRKAADQMISALTMTGLLAAQYGVTVALQPVCSAESDLVNTIKDAMYIVSAVNHANIKCALHTYHFWQQDDSIEELAKAAGMIAHVHLADREDKLPPGESDHSDYRPIFQILQSSGYKGLMSVNCDQLPVSDMRTGRILTFLKRQWQAAGGK